METEQTSDGVYGIDPILGITILFALVVVSITSILIFVFSRIPKQYGSTTRAALDKVELLKLSTIFIIIMATTYLSILDKLPQGVIAIFSGIAGYVLGTVKRTDDKDSTLSSPNNQS